MTSYMTSQRKLLYSFLKSHPDRQFSAREIAGALTDHGISQSAVYRNLTALEAQGLITRSMKEGCHETFYQFTHADACLNRIHMTCLKCGRTIHMDHDAAVKMMQHVLQTDGFRISTGKTILYGFCKNCNI